MVDLTVLREGIIMTKMILYVQNVLAPHFECQLQKKQGAKNC